MNPSSGSQPPDEREMPLALAARRAELAAQWQGGPAAGDPDFDRALLAAVRRRAAPRFFFTPAEVAARAAAVAARCAADVARTVDRADAVLAHRFPLHDGWHAAYDVQLPADIAWLANPTAEPEFIYALNRHRPWIELALAYRYTGDARYADELGRLLATWVAQNPPLDDPREWRKTSPRWHLLDAAIRGDTWVWAYFLMVDSPAWTPALNTLFLHTLWLHGRFLAALTPRDGSGANWAIMEAQGLFNIALLFPEFRDSTAWEAQALDQLSAALDVQFWPDGGHLEQSPDYHVGCIQWLVEPLWLAKLNGRAAVDKPWLKLRQITECAWQMLHPDGTLAGVSDTEPESVEAFAIPAVAMGEPKWGCFEALSARLIWLFGADVALPRGAVARPTAIAFPDSGYYVMRSGEAVRACQITFDCGPKGLWHGHFDLLSIECYGFGKALLCDPGRLIYGNTPERHWIVSTPAHNTISVDDANHAAIETPHDPALAVDAWEVADDHVLARARHTAYAHLAGRPQVGRTLWFNRRDLLILVDWGIAETAHAFKVSFLFPGEAVSALRAGELRSLWPEGNVQVQALLLPEQTAAREVRLWSPHYSERAPAIQFTVSQRAPAAIFGTVVCLYPGAQPPDLSAEWVEPPRLGAPTCIRVRRGTVEQVVTLPPVGPA